MSSEATPGRWVPLALATVYLVWSSTYWAVRVVVDGMPPLAMASARYLATGGAVLAVLKWRGAPWPSMAQWLYCAPVGLLMFLGGNGTVSYAEQHISSGAAAVLCGTMPLWMAALGPLFGERASRREWWAMALGFAGIAALSMTRELQAEPWSAALVMVAPVTWALGSLLSRRWPLPSGLMGAALQMLTGGVAMGVVSWVLGEPRIKWLEVPRSSVLAWLYLCVFGSLVGYSAYTYLLKHARPAVATSYAYVNPVMAVALGAAVGGEAVGPATLVAVVLIIGATVLVIRGRVQ